MELVEAEGEACGAEGGETEVEEEGCKVGVRKEERLLGCLVAWLPK